MPEWPSYGNFCQVTQTRIFWKSEKGGTREIFQKLPKKWPSLKKPISSLAQVALSSNLYAIKVQRLEMILAETAAPKVPEWPSYNIFCKVTQNPHFLKKCKRGNKGNFSKIAQKVALVWKAQKHSGAIFAMSPKTRIFCKSANGGPREIFQKSPKKRPSLKRPKSTLAQMALSSN